MVSGIISVWAHDYLFQPLFVYGPEIRYVHKFAVVKDITGTRRIMSDETNGRDFDVIDKKALLCSISLDIRAGLPHQRC
ncbi:MAG: hypothetical protein ACLU99_07365 [Alphaproteobacteria bacterium]